MKAFLLIPVLLLLISSCKKDDPPKVPVSMKISAITCNYWQSLDSSGDTWDIGSAPDPFISIDEGTDATGNFFSSPSYYPDVSSFPLEMSSGMPVTITSLNSNWNFGLWDYDFPYSDADLMGGVYFLPMDYSNGFPSTITVGNASVEFTLTVEWNF